MVFEDAKETPKLHLEIDPNRLSQIVGTAVWTSTEIVNFHLNSLSDENLDRSQREMVGQPLYRFRGPNLTNDQRREMHENWVLAKAFQDLLRAVRHALEEAYVLVSLLNKKHKIKSNATLAEFFKPFRSKAAGLRFPELLETVNKLLDPKIEFAESYRSLQMARNCLEHRAGIVGDFETKGAAEFTLSIPRIKLFYLRGDEEIELAIGQRVEPGDGRPEVEILMRMETRKRSIPLGNRVAFTRQEFGEIAFACNQLGQRLSSGLPKPEIAR